MLMSLDISIWVNEYIPFKIRANGVGWLVGWRYRILGPDNYTWIYHIEICPI